MTDISEWLATKIDEHAPSPDSSIDAAVRLADACAALESPPRAPMAFGLALPVDVANRAALHDRAIAHLRGWFSFVDDATREQLADAIRHLALPVDIPVGDAPKVCGSCHIDLRVEVLAYDSAGEETRVTDLEVLRALHDWTEGGTELTSLPALMELDWLASGRASLRFDESANALRCRLAFGGLRPPSDHELDALRHTVESTLLFSAWGMNLEFYPRDGSESDLDVDIDVEPEIVGPVRFEAIV